MYDRRRAKFPPSPHSLAQSGDSLMKNISLTCDNYGWACECYIPSWKLHPMRANVVVVFVLLFATRAERSLSSAASWKRSMRSDLKYWTIKGSSLLLSRIVRCLFCENLPTFVSVSSSSLSGRRRRIQKSFTVWLLRRHEQEKQK